MREIVRSGVVKEWVSGRIDPNKYLDYYRQIGSNPSMLSLRIDVAEVSGKRIQVPTSLISSTQIDMALTELFAPATAACDGDFDRLMVPFLCVASDMNHRGAVVIRRGELSEAIRSSMSIPLVFKPVKKDSMLLYDGGIYDNFPWKPLDETFRPDLIVGSICTAGNTPPTDESSLLTRPSCSPCSRPTTSCPPAAASRSAAAVKAGMLDFDHAEQIMDAGYEDAMAAMPEILRRIGGRQGTVDYAARRAAFRALCPPLVFNDYRLEGLNRKQRAYIRDFVQVDRRTPAAAPDGFDELRDNPLRGARAANSSMEFPTCATTPSSGAIPSGPASTRAPTSRSPSAATSPRRPSTRPTSA